MTILEQSLAFIGTSIAGGITWDLLKSSGSTIIESFKSKFKNSNNFTNDEQCIDFLERIVSRLSNSSKNPLRDIQITYEDITDNVNNAEIFTKDFKDWLIDHESDFKNLVTRNSQSAFLNISNQSNIGSGTIINTGIFNGNMWR